MRTKNLSVIFASASVAFAVVGCGGSGHATHPKTSTATPPANPPASTTTSAAPPPAPRLRIIAPRPGAVTSQTLTVRLSLTGAAPHGPHAVRYVLDGALVRLGSVRLTFHGLAFGRHHLTVMLASRRSVRATRSFRVPAPAVVPAPAAAPAPTTSTPSPATTPAPAAAPAPTTTTAPAATPAPSSTGGIPQGANAGDADADNHGGPSDGDGNI
jgi:hypothetical protein